MSPAWLILAQSALSQAIKPDTARTASAGAVLLLAVAAVVGLSIAAFYAWSTFLKSSKENRSGSPQLLFRELCQVHQLNRVERSLLAKLAQTYDLPQPASLFVDPWQLDQAAAADDPDAAEYGQLRRQLFGSAV